MHPKYRYIVVSAAIALLFGCVQMTQAKPAENTPVANAESPAAKNTIKLGLLLSLSGVGEKVGNEMLNGAKLYLDEINYQMGNRKVELVVENDETTPARAMEKVRKLAEQNVNVIDGVYFSHIAYAVAPVADSVHVPLVISVAGADDLTKRKCQHWVLRTGWCSSLNLPLGEYVAKDLHYKRVVTVAMDYPFGYEIVGDFQKTYEDSGGQIVQKLWAPLGFTDFSSLLKQIRKDADAVFLCTIGPACEIIPRQYKELGFTMPLVGTGTSFDEPLFAKIGSQLEGGISSLPYSQALDTPANKRFLTSYRTKYGTDATWAAQCEYSSIMWIAKAVNSLKGNIDDKNKFLAALRSAELKESPKGPEKLDAWGNPIENVYIRKVEKVNGKFQNKVIFTYPMVSQFWKYKPEEYMKQPPWSKDYPPCKYCDH